MRSLLYPQLLTVCLLGLASLAHAQTPTATDLATDKKWQRLQHFELESDNSVASTDLDSGASTNRPAANSTGAQKAARFLAKADELSDFRTSNSGDKRAKEARRLEALMLVYASLSDPGSTALKTRCADVVQQVRADSDLPAAARFSIASLADHREASLGQFASDEARLDKFEEIGRSLLQEFPDLTQPYEGLLRLADDSPDQRATRLATDLLGMKKTPAEVRQAAQLLLDRQALVGQSLQSLLNSSLPAKSTPTLTAGRVTILYAWASWNEGALQAASMIAAQAPKGAVILGVNCDTDVAAAKKVARDRGLPGTQLYDGAGLNAKLAKTLKLTGKDLVYLTGRDGLITTVSARRDLAASLASTN